MNQRAFFAGGLALILAAVIFAVRVTSGDNATENTPASSRDVAQSAPGIGFRSDGEARFSIRQGAGPRERSNDELTEEMENILSNVDLLTRARRWLDFVNSLDAGEFEAVLVDFKANYRYEESTREELNILLSAWAKVDPLGAITWAYKNYGGGPITTILATWAASDLNAAIQWAETTIKRDRYNDYLMVGVITGICQDDPALATSLMVKMPYSRVRGRALAVVLPQIERQGPDATREWIDSLPDETLRASARDVLANGFDRAYSSTKRY